MLNRFVHSVADDAKVITHGSLHYSLLALRLRLFCHAFQLEISVLAPGALLEFSQSPKRKALNSESQPPESLYTKTLLNQPLPYSPQQERPLDLHAQICPYFPFRTLLQTFKEPFTKPFQHPKPQTANTYSLSVMKPGSELRAVGHPTKSSGRTRKPLEGYGYIGCRSLGGLPCGLGIEVLRCMVSPQSLNLDFGLRASTLSSGFWP